MKLIPLEDRVIILQDEGQAKTAAGIIVPDAYKHKPSSGTVVEIGPGKPGMAEKIGYFVNDEFVTDLKQIEDLKITDRVVPVYPTAFKIGDHVYFAPFTGAPVMVDGVEHLVVRFTDIISRD